ncbi:50S ribosomal protein L25/general stress protein Ctc [Leifsonia sp. ALI-44-B]|jgi:large subunit ribosomal protein L25|uniref:50S ribosomal protein L25/general stress protein Ctc n=1 Tax=Leifsonia sp. ALI-44-B TaxID=1933776 RepID=UPI00097C1D1D|nr:50S ribosomal protein L25/general stress protein Ctc [Leifsonia sp. ALI-44-B]ONI64038.1 50S ribosomal protein L25/general stress protein Ctc [Leifsonia sp. ALI-44-B]
MADENKVVAELRESFGKGAARKLRALGKIPAVIYGHGGEPQHVSLPGHQVALIIRKSNAVLALDIDGTTQLTLVKDVQKDPVRQVIEHLDLIVVRQGEKVEVEVPIRVEGESYPGTIASLETTTLLVSVEATHIPEGFELSVEGLEEGQHVFAKDVPLPAGATLISDPELLVVGIMVPAATLAEGEEGEGSESTEAAAE